MLRDKLPTPMPKAVAKKRLVLLDAHAIIHRAYHALPDFTTPTGEPSGARQFRATVSRSPLTLSDGRLSDGRCVACALT